MPTSPDILTQYLPRFLAQRLATSGAAGFETKPVLARLPAAVLFADIAGFTTLTEQLAEEAGPAGAEAITTVLNDYFGRLIDHIERYGGDVIKFAGDGLLALWAADAGTPDVPLATLTARAVRCAFVMQTRLRDYVTATGHTLEMHIGVGAGEVALAQLGGVGGHWEWLLTGTPVAQMMAAEARATRGGVVLAPEAGVLVRALCQGHSDADGYVTVTHVASTAQLPPLVVSAKPSLPALPETALRAYLPPTILARLAAGQSDWLAELRRVTVLFINLPGLGQTLESAEALQNAQAVVQLVQAALDRFEGTLNKLNVDDKGVTVVAALGLPPLAHEDDAARGVLAALSIRDALRAQQLPYAIGVTTGRVFCGSVGGATRREYTMMGDVVNLAARLMQAAPNDLLCDGLTRDAAETRVEFEPLPPIQVKGKTEPVVVVHPKGERRRFLRSQVMLVGRAAERALLAASLHHFAHQPDFCRVILLEGEAGMGKSRLVEETRLQAERLGLPVFGGAGDAVEKTTPYFAWREVFGEVFDLALFEGPAAQKRHILLALGAERFARAPLLKTVLPALEIADNNYTRQLTGQARAESTRDLLIQILQASFKRAPKVIILEDAHWLDSASWALVLAATHLVRPCLLIIATRPLAEPLPAEYVTLRALPETRAISLNNLTTAETMQLVAQRLGVRALPDAVTAFIMEKAEGNPFFSEELAYALRDGGLLTIAQGECQLAAQVDLNTLELPDTVEGIITSRIDYLSPAHQLTLKVASVIGRVFQYRTLQDIHPIATDRGLLEEYLIYLQRLDLTPLEAPEPEVAYIFKHIITQEVAYNLLPYAQRQSLHRAVAEWYERIYAHDLTPYYGILAHHWRQAENLDRAVNYLQQAGAAAFRLSAFRETEAFCAQALEMLGFDAPDFATRATPQTQSAAAQLAYHAGAALWGLGNYPRAQQRLAAGAQLAHALDNPMLAVDCRSQLGRVKLEMGDYGAAQELLDSTIALARQIAYGAGLVELLLARGYLALNDEAYVASQAQFEEGLALAEQLGNRYLIGRGHNLLGILAVYRGQLADGRTHFLEYLAIMRETGATHGLCVALMNLGELEYRMGLLAEGQTHLQESLQVGRQNGERLVVAIDAALLTLLWSDWRDPVRAAQYAREALSEAWAIQALPRVLYALACAARLAALQNEPALALSCLGLALRHPATNADVRNMGEFVLEPFKATHAPEAVETALAAGAAQPLETGVAQLQAALERWLA